MALARGPRPELRTLALVQLAMSCALACAGSRTCDAPTEPSTSTEAREAPDDRPGPDEGDAERESRPRASEPGIVAVPGQALVLLIDDVDWDAITLPAASLPGLPLETLPWSCEVPVAAGPRHVLVRCAHDSGEPVAIDDLVRRLRALPTVEAADPNWRREPRD
jgi:hypothetical protein